MKGPFEPRCLALGGLELLPGLVEFLAQPVDRGLQIGGVMLMCVQDRLGLGAFPLGLGVLLFDLVGAGL